MRGRIYPLVLLAAILFFDEPARAQGLVAQLSRETILINQNFTGTELILFGTIERDPLEIVDQFTRPGRPSDAAARAERGDIVVILKGPPEEVRVRRKGRAGLIWMNMESLTFVDVPSFYLVATTAPLDEIATPQTLKNVQFGLANIALTPKQKKDAARATEFRAGLIRNKQRQKLYVESIGAVEFTGSLFSTRLSIPANVPVGYYSAEVYLLRDGAVVAAQNWPLLIDKSGFERWAFRLADEEPVIYGFIAIVLAVAAGVGAAAVVRH